MSSSRPQAVRPDIRRAVMEQTSTLAIRNMIAAGERQFRADAPIIPNEIAVRKLHHELREELVRLQAVATILRTAASRVDTEKPTFDAGIHAWDEAFACDLEENYEEYGVRAAHAVRLSSQQRAAAFLVDHDTSKLWKLWQYDEVVDCCPYLLMLGLVLWLAYIRDEYLKAISRPAALTLPIHAKVFLAHQRDTRIVEPSTGPPVLCTRDNSHIALLERHQSEILPPVPKIERNMAIAMIQQTIPYLASLDAQRVIRWEILVGHKQRQAQHHDPRCIDIPGGWSALAQELKIADKSAPDRIRNIVLAQAHLRFRLPGKTERYANLLSYTERVATGQEPSHVRLVLGSILMPGHIYDYAESDFDWPTDYHNARKLVPIVELPPFVGRKNDWEPQAALSTWILVEMRNQAKDAEQHGSVSLDTEKLDELARRASLPASLLARVIDRWTRDGDDGPAFLRRIEPHRYALGEAHGHEWQYLQAAGMSERAAQEAGKRAVMVRWRRDRARFLGGFERRKKRRLGKWNTKP